MKLKEMNEKVKTTQIALCKRRVQLYASYENIGVDSLNDILEGARVWQKDSIGLLSADLDNHGLKTKFDQDNWLHNPTTKLKITDGGDFKANAIGKSSQTALCANENCGRMFHSKKRCTGVLEVIIQNPRFRPPIVVIKMKLIKELKELEIPQQPSNGSPKRQIRLPSVRL